MREAGIRMKMKSVSCWLIGIVAMLGGCAVARAEDSMQRQAVRRAKVGISAASSIAIKALSNMGSFEAISVPRLLSDLLWLQEDEYEVSKPVSSVKMKGGGILIITKGARNSLSSIGLPQHKDRVLCHYDKQTLVLGIRPQGFSEQREEFNHRSSTTIFRLTYVDELPDIALEGKAFVYVERGVATQKKALKMTGASSCMCSSLEAPEYVISQKGGVLKIDGLRSEKLSLAVKDTAKTAITGMRVTEHATVAAEGSAEDAVANVRLQGSVASMKLALGKYSVLEAQSCVVRDLHVKANRLFSMATVNASHLLKVEGSKSVTPIEYVGLPEQIVNDAGIPLHRAGLPPVFSWLSGKAADLVERRLGVRPASSQADGIMEQATEEAVLAPTVE